jgi:hypothetical protein
MSDRDLGKRSVCSAATDVPEKRARRKAPPKVVSLCFDLNGTLCSLTKNRRKGRTRLRPGCAELRRLRAAGFALCVWSSATPPTVSKIVEMLRVECGVTFDRILTRDDCVRVGRRHATIKPLRERGQFDVRRTVLIDDSAVKAAPGEAGNMLCAPAWTNDDPLDCYIPALVDALLDSGGACAASKEGSSKGFEAPDGPPHLLVSDDVRSLASCVARKAHVAASWEAVLSRKAGKIYYFNRLTGKSSWTPPRFFRPLARVPARADGV